MATLHVTEIRDEWSKKPQAGLRVGSLMYARVIAPSDTSGERAIDHASVRESVVAEGVDAAPRPKKNADLRKGDRVQGYVVSSGPKGVFLALSRTVTARIQLRHLSEDFLEPSKVMELFPSGTLLEATVLAVDASGDVQASVIGAAKAAYAWETLAEGQVVRAEVKKKESFGIFLRLKVAGPHFFTPQNDSA